MKRILPILAAAALFAAALFPLLNAEREAAGTDQRKLPVLMYHSVLKDARRAGKYVVSPDTFESDMRYLLDHGYESVLPSELVAFADGSGRLPDKPVLITLDDGYYNNLTYVLPILDRLNMKAVVDVVGQYAETFSERSDPNPNYAYLSWDEITELADSGRVEIGNHTYDMHTESSRLGCMKKRGEDIDTYRALLIGDLGRLQTLLESRAHVNCVTFAYPFGDISPEATEVLKELGFQCTLTCYERINTVVRGDPDSLFMLGRYNRPAGMSTESFMARVLRD